MAVVKLPSGRTVKIPDGMNKDQAIEFLFDNLDGKKGFEDDRKKLGDQLDTSGWGATIGGTIGSIVGSTAGFFGGFGVGAIPGGIAGGAGGAAIGEGIEQWLTGKGDWSDIGWAGVEGGAWGAIPGGAGQAGKVATKAGLKGVAKVGAQSAAGAATGATIGAGTGAVTGVGAKEGAISGGITGAFGGPKIGPKIGGLLTGSKAGEAVQKGVSKGLSTASSKLGLDKPVKSAVEIAKDYGKSYLNAQWLKATGRKTAGQLNQSAANWQLRRDLVNKVFGEAKKAFEKNAGRTATSAELSQLKKAATNEAEDLFKQQLRGRSGNLLEPASKPSGKIIRHKGQDVLQTKDGLYDLKGNFIGDFALGGFTDMPMKTGGLLNRR